MLRFLIFIFVLFFLIQAAYSQDIPFAPDLKQIEQGQERMEQERERIEQEQERIRKQELEFLEKNDPQEYKKRKRHYERQEEISQIIKSFYKKEITEDRARRKLYPLVNEKMQDRVSNLDAEIKQQRERLDFLQRAKQNSNILIDKYIDRMLGKEDSASSLYDF